MRERWKAWTIALGLLTVIGLTALAFPWLLRSGPDGRLVLAVGGADGAYLALAETYKADLKRHGVKLELRTDLMGNDLIKALNDPKSGIDGGIIKGGFMGSLSGRLASSKARARHDEETLATRSVGRLMLEPIWVFTRGDLPITTLRDLKGKRILTGTSKSGGRRVVLQLLRANGLNADNTVRIDEDLDDTASALFNGKADAAMIILPAESDRIQRLLRVANIRLMDFSPESQAYSSRFPAISSVVLSRGSVEFEPVIPSADITLLATSAAMIVKRSTHPALTSLLAHAVDHNPKSSLDKAGDPVLFFKGGQFPHAEDPEYDVAPDIKAIHKSGELPFLLKYLAPVTARFNLPFSLTSFASAYGVQTVLLLIPALTILWPLFKLVPMAYKWSIRQRLLYWYNELKLLERRLERSRPGEHAEAFGAEIERIDHAARRIRVPLEFSDQHYDLRGHIDLVRRRVLDHQRTIERVQAGAMVAAE